MRLAILGAVLAALAAGCVYHYQSTTAPRSDRMELAMTADGTGAQAN